tara:strand:- start:42 stop:2210 length:2169 start_codon:yes stop_codon:yes gene_type:complete
MSESYGGLTDEELDRRIAATAPKESNTDRDKRIQGLSTADLDAKILSTKPNLPTPLEAGVRGGLRGFRAAMQGPSLGYADEAEAGIRSVFNGTPYREEKTSVDAEMSDHSNEYPWSSNLGAAAAGLVNPVDKVSKLKGVYKVGENVVRGAVEGYGAAQLDKGTEGTGYGAAIGAVLGTLGRLGSSVLDTAVAKRIEKSLFTSDGTFIPINMVDESALGDFYRNTVSRAFGSGGIRKQSLEVVKEQEAIVQELVDTHKRAIKSQTDAIDIDEQKILSDSGQQKLGAEYNAEIETTNINSQARLDAAEVDARAASAAQTGRQSVVATSFSDSIPDNWPDKQKIVARSAQDPMGATEDLEKLWSDNGFKIIRQKTDFNVDSKQLNGSIKANTDPADWVNIEKDVDAALKLLPDAAGQIDGNTFMQARNHLRQTARQQSFDGAGPSKARALNMAADEIDAVMTAQLPAKAQAAFTEELGRYGNFINTRSAVGATIIAKGGVFGPEDLLKQQQHGGGKKWRTGQVRGQQGALDAQQAEQQAGISLNRSREAVTERQKTQNQTVAGNLAASKDEIDTNLGLQKARIKQQRDPIKLEEGVPIEVREGLVNAQAQLAKFKENTPTKTRGTYEPILATGVLGSPVTSVASLLGIPIADSLGVGIASGVVIGKALSTQSVQKALAGQTAAQTQMRKMLQTYSGSDYEKFMQSLTPSAAGTLVRLGIIEDVNE